MQKKLLTYSTQLEINGDNVEQAIVDLFKKIDEIEDQVKQEKKDFKEAKGAKYVKRDAVKKIIAAWVITVPASALIAAGIYYMIKGIVAV